MRKGSFHSGIRPALLLVALSLALGMLSLLFAMQEGRMELLAGYVSNPLIVLLNLLPCVVLTALLLALTGRAALSFAAAGAAVMGLTWVGWFKMQFRDDPLTAADLVLIREAGDMAGKYRLFLPAGLVATILCIAAGTALLACCVRQRPSGRLRAGLAAAVLLLLLPLRALYFSDAVYRVYTESRAVAGRWDVTRVYQSKGFLYPFLHSFRKAAAPQGYRQAEAESRLSAYADAGIPPERRVNIVAVMLESFCDFTGTPNAPVLKETVYGPWHALEEEGISGTLITNIFAGGTVDTERSFLTGYPVLPAFDRPTESFVWYLRRQGWQTTGSHPGNRWFYHRDQINARLGFSEYRFLEDFYGALAGGGIAPDDVLFPALAQLCREERSPYFSFTVSYQGHGPYPDSHSAWDGVYLADDGYSDAEYYILNNYFASVANTAANVAALADALRESDAPVVLLVFGDHKPWLGDHQAVYKALGIPVDCSTDEGFLCHYSTPYLIWGNTSAKQALGRELCGKGPDIGPSMLMCTLFDALGWEGPPLMQSQRALMEAGVTMYHSAAENVLYQGRLCTPEALPDPVRALLQNYLEDAFTVQRRTPESEQRSKAVGIAAENAPL